MGVSQPKITITCDNCDYSMDFHANDFVDIKDIIHELEEFEWIIVENSADMLYFCSDECYQDNKFSI